MTYKLTVRIFCILIILLQVHLIYLALNSIAFALDSDGLFDSRAIVFPSCAIVASFSILWITRSVDVGRKEEPIDGVLDDFLSDLLMVWIANKRVLQRLS